MNTDELINEMIKEIWDNFYNCSKYTDTEEVDKASEKIYNLYHNDERFDNIRYDLD